jgi:hypothetical protein
VTAQVHHRFDLAAKQLETAIMLFISGHERFSVITLSAAADAILSQLVNNKGEKTFVETIVAGSEDELRARGEMGKHIHDVLFINALKHLDKGDNDSVVLDVEECALASILVAIANFITLRERGTVFVEAFLLWVKQNLDPTVYNVDCDPNWNPSRSKPV